MQESKSCALPLGDSPLRWVEGFEPSASRATIWRANQLRHTHHSQDSLTNVPEGIRTPDPRLRRPLLYPAELRTRSSGFPGKRVMGIEPTYLAWKASVLPLNYTRIRIGVTGFEPATSWSQTRRSSQAEPHPGYFIPPSSVTQELLYNMAISLSIFFSHFTRSLPAPKIHRYRIL